MFQAVPLPINRSSKLHSRHRVFVELQLYTIIRPMNVKPKKTGVSFLFSLFFPSNLLCSSFVLVYFFLCISAWIVLEPVNISIRC